MAKIEKELSKRDLKEAKVEANKEEEKPVNEEPMRWEAVKEDDLFRLEGMGDNSVVEAVDSATEWKRTFKDPLSITEDLPEDDDKPKHHEASLYLQSSKRIANLESLLPQVHIQSSQFDPKTFLETMHGETSIEELKRKEEVLNAAEDNANHAEKQLIVNNLHYFAMIRHILEEVNGAMFGQRGRGSNAYTMIKDIEGEFRGFGERVKRHVDPARKTRKELAGMDRDMDFVQSLDDFFELNAQIVRYIENQDIRKFVESYKEYEKKIQSYKSLTHVSSLVEKIEFIVKKAKSMILTKLLEEDKISFDKLEESLRYLRELGSSDDLIMPLLQERKNRLIARINERFTPTIRATKKQSEDLSFSINLLRNREEDERADDISLKNKIKTCFDVKDPVDAFVDCLVGRNDSRIGNRVNEAYMHDLKQLGKEMVDEIALINQIVAVYTSRGNREEAPKEEIPKVKVFEEIVFYLYGMVETTFLQSLLPNKSAEALDKSISVIQQITCMSVFPQESLLFGDRTFSVALFLSDLEQQLSPLLPPKLTNLLSDLTGKFAQAYVNKVFFDIYTQMNSLDLRSDLTLATAEHGEEPLFMDEFKALVFQGIEDIQHFLERVHKSRINNKTIMQALKTPLQNIVINLLVLVFKGSKELSKRVTQQKIVQGAGFTFDENVDAAVMP